MGVWAARRHGRPTDSRLPSICGTKTGAGMSTWSRHAVARRFASPIIPPTTSCRAGRVTGMDLFRLDPQRQLSDLENVSARRRRVQVTQHGGTYAKESIDGKYLYYGTGLTALWRVPVAGGEEVEVFSRLASYGNFAVAADGIYFEELDFREIRSATRPISLRSRAWRRRSTFSASRPERSIASSRSIGTPGMASTCRLTSEHCSSLRWMTSPKT